MSPLNRKAGDRRLVKMSPAPGPWSPELPPEGVPYEQEFPISAEVSYIQRLEQDQYGRIVEWAVIQMRVVDGRHQRVVVYDTCHGKGLHAHFYDREDTEFAEEAYRPINSYDDLEAGLDYALERVSQAWQENQRRSDRGR